MKNITVILFLFVLLGFFACKKSKTEVIIAHRNMTPKEQALAGNWAYRKYKSYSNGSEIFYLNFYDASTSYLNLQSVPSENVSNTFKCISQLINNGTTPDYQSWNVDTTVTPNLLVFWNQYPGSGMQILFFNSDSLILKQNTGINSYDLFILNKTSYTCTMSPKENLIAKNWAFNSSDILDASGQISSTTTYVSPSLYYLNLGNQWNQSIPSPGIAGWKCSAGTGSPLGTRTSSWELLNNDSTIHFNLVDPYIYNNYNRVFKIDTLDTNALVFSIFQTGVGGQRFHLH